MACTHMFPVDISPVSLLHRISKTQSQLSCNSHPLSECCPALCPGAESSSPITPCNHLKFSRMPWIPLPRWNFPCLRTSISTCLTVCLHYSTPWICKSSSHWNIKPASQRLGSRGMAGFSVSWFPSWLSPYLSHLNIELSSQQVPRAHWIVHKLFSLFRTHLFPTLCR